MKPSRDFAYDVMLEALLIIVANTESDAIKHRDYDHLAKDICDCASAAVEVAAAAGGMTNAAL